LAGLANLISRVITLFGNIGNPGEFGFTALVRQATHGLPGSTKRKREFASGINIVESLDGVDYSLPVVDRPSEPAGFYRQKHAALRALK
jgi:hypothetical protein